jgi:glycosyltransferase involved in cell wall biosynthesis
MGDRGAVGYLMSRFPKLTETFVLYEMRAVEQLGVRVEVFPLLRARATGEHPEGRGLLWKLVERLVPSRAPLVMHPEAVPYAARAHYVPFLSWPILRANWRAFRRRPRRYLRTLATLEAETLGSFNLLLGGLAIFPKAVFFGEEMRRLGVRHVHAHFANHPATAAWVISRISGIPYSFTGHGADLQVDQQMLARKVRDARAVVTISDYSRAFIGEHCGSASTRSVSVIRCGVDLATFPADGRTTGVHDPVELLCVGTFYEVKGHPQLIEACRLLVERGRRIRCRLIGEGPDRATLERQVREAGLEEVVVFEGPRPRDEVLAAMRCADSLVVPSIPTASGRREGLPVVLIEAMASRLPVVASAISGIPELVIDGVTGLLVPPRDPAAIADAVECLIDDAALRERLADAGRRAVESQFDLAKNAERLVGLFADARA